MKEDRTWLIKMEFEEKHFLTLFDDGYVFNENGKKMFVLHKAPMQQVRNLIEEYSTGDDGTADNPKLTLKCNVDPIYISHNNVFALQLRDLILNNRNIKHPKANMALIIDQLHEVDDNGELYLLYEDDETDDDWS